MFNRAVASRELILEAHRMTLTTRTFLKDFQKNETLITLRMFAEAELQTISTGKNIIGIVLTIQNSKNKRNDNKDKIKQ